MHFSRLGEVHINTDINYYLQITVKIISDSNNHIFDRTVDNEIYDDIQSESVIKKIIKNRLYRNMEEN